MPRSAPLLASFNVGEISPRLYARTDFQKYAKALRQCVNFLPLVQGPVTKRPGTYFVQSVKYPDKAVRLLPFVFSADQAFVLEFGDHYIRFYRNHGLVGSSKPVTGAANNGGGLIRLTIPTHGYQTGWTMAVTAVGGVPAATGTWSITVIDDDHVDLQGSTFAGAFTSGGTAIATVEVETPYGLGDLQELQIVQSGDIVYIAHASHQPRKLKRVSNVQWTLTTVNFIEGPFQKTNSDKAITVVPSAETGTGITLTASGADTFTTSMVGRLFLIEAKDAADVPVWEASKGTSIGAVRRNDGRYYEAKAGSRTGSVAPMHTEGLAYDGTSGLSDGVQWEFLHAGYGWVRINSVTSGTSANADVISRLPAQCVSGGTYKWAKPAWTTANWPACVALHDQRLVFAGTQSQPDTVWFSVVADYETFGSRDKGGKIVADQAITITLATSQFNSIKWLASDSKGLLVGTSGSEHVVTAITSSDAFGPGNTKAVAQSNWGSAALPVVAAGGAKLMLQRSKRKIREMIYNFDSDRYQSPDLTLLADHLTEDTTIEAIAWQQEPHAVLWCARSDGVLLGFTYNREQDVAGWHRHRLGGDGFVESATCIPSSDGTRDELWLSIRRTIDGAVSRYIEFLKPFQSSTRNLESSYFVDCGLSYEGAPVNMLHGLDHLKGMEVAILADGAIVAGPNIVNADGSIGLPRPASIVHVGLPYRAQIQTLRLEAGAADGTAQGKIKRINEVVVRLETSLGGRYGHSDVATLPFHFHGTTDPMDQAPGLYTGDYPIVWPGGYSRDDGMTIMQDEPLPFTLIALMPRLTTQDR